MLYVRELLFDQWNEDHIAQHSVIPEKSRRFVWATLSCPEPGKGDCESLAKQGLADI